ncbi:MAG TPA: phasin family protein [Nitrospiria bacterium]|nr:phasin family protein [Nitrospiria bacterium]
MLAGVLNQQLSLTLKEIEMFNTADQIAALNQMVTINKANLEAAFNFANTILAGTERLLNLQLNAAEDVLVENANALVTAKDPKDLSALRAAFEANLEKTLSYSRSVYEAAVETRSELVKIVEGRVAQFNNNLVEALEKALKSAPAGSEPAVSALRSGIAAANSAYAAISKAAKQAGEMAEANIAAATQAASKKKPNP